MGLSGSKGPLGQNGPNGPNGPNGFTLIEMMVVMVLLGLMSTLALPAMQRWHDAVQLRAQLALVVESLRAEIFSAASRRQDVVMDMGSFGQNAASAGASAAGGAGRAKVAMPTGWVAERVVEATFMKNGLCKPGMVILRQPEGHRVVLQVAGPSCAVDTLTDVPAALR
jgi:prepilin-type N-terminal cleavage/methylation domain-containing protein